MLAFLVSGLEHPTINNIFFISTVPSSWFEQTHQLEVDSRTYRRLTMHVGCIPLY